MSECDSHTHTHTHTTHSLLLLLPLAELVAFQRRRVAAFRKGIVQYTQYQVRQAREKAHTWNQIIDALETDQPTEA